MPHTIITYPTTRSQSNVENQQTIAPITHPTTSATSSENRSVSPNDSPHRTNMADSALVARARKTRYDNLPNFSGNASDDAERFLKTIKNITKANDDSTDLQFLEIVRGKLTHAAGTWFDDHESQFTRWSEFETVFRNRYFSTTMIRTKFDKLTQRKQLYDESVTSYFDEIVTLCREIDPNMPDAVIIQHLMSGINPEFRKELSRRESAMQILTEFLKHAKTSKICTTHSTNFKASELTNRKPSQRIICLQTRNPYRKYENPKTISPSTTNGIDGHNRQYDRAPSPLGTRTKTLPRTFLSRRTRSILVEAIHRVDNIANRHPHSNTDHAQSVVKIGRAHV